SADSDDGQDSPFARRAAHNLRRARRANTTTAARILPRPARILASKRPTRTPTRSRGRPARIQARACRRAWPDQRSLSPPKHHNPPAKTRREPAKGEAPEPNISLTKRTVAPKSPDDQLAMFIHDCNRRGVHPLDKLIVLTNAGGKYTPITTIDYMRSRAAETG